MPLYRAPSCLRELYRSTRPIMNGNKAKHKHESNSLLYLPVGKGGKGMQELETLYKTTKIKTSHHLTVSADPRVQLVSTFQDVKEKKSLRSIVKDARTLYTTRHDRLLRAVYYAILKTLGITNNQEDETIPWYRELQPKCVETKEVKVLWNILLHLDVVPKDVDGANKPDMALCNKKERQWLKYEGTVCNTGQIQEQDKLKTEKYADLRASSKRLYPGYNVIQVNLVNDFHLNFRC